MVLLILGAVLSYEPAVRCLSTWVKHLCIYIAAGSVDQAVVLVPEGSISTGDSGCSWQKHPPGPHR